MELLVSGACEECGVEGREGEEEDEESEECYEGEGVSEVVDCKGHSG